MRALRPFNRRFGLRPLTAGLFALGLAPAAAQDYPRQADR